MSELMPMAIIALLILANAIFVAAEFAIIGAPRAGIARRAAEGNPVAIRVRSILQDARQQDQYIATAQLGITLASLGLGMYGEHVVASWLLRGIDNITLLDIGTAHVLASIAAVTILTFLHIVLGEMVPKSLALQYAENAALRITRPMSWVHHALYPLVAMLNALGNLTLRMIGIREPVRTGLSFHSLEELQYIVQESREGGFLREESGAVLQELLEFADLTAGEVMVPRVRIVGIPLAAPAREVAPILRGSLHTRYPVFTGDLDHIVGVIHVKDVLRLLLSQQGVSETQVHAPPYVPEAAPLDQVLAAMIKARTQMVIVMDEHGGTAGIVTLEDLFEEVIGEIEETTRKPPVHIDAGGIIHAAGTARLEELGEEIDRDLEHEEIDTISGLVLALLGRPPETGDEVVWNGMVFRVTRVEGRGVGECVVEILDTSEANP